MTNISCRDENSSSNEISRSFVVYNIILVFIFTIGLILQIRIIQVSKKEKDITWRTDICHSIVMIGFYFIRIVFEDLTFFVPCLNLITGEWICHVLYFIYMFGALSIASHSFMLSFYKYLYIVHDSLIRLIGREKCGIILFWTSLLAPALLAMSFVARPSDQYVTYSSVYKCRGYDIQKLAKDNQAFDEQFKTYFFCKFMHYNENEKLSIFDYLMITIDTIGCFVTGAIVFIVMMNIMEAFFYIRVFSFTKSKIDPQQNVIALHHVPERTSIESMKRLRVSAQVTAMSTIIEVLGNLTFMVIWIFISKFADFSTLVTGMALYFVILPYVFLMNTSQNKAQIVEEGWIPIIKNIFRIRCYHFDLLDGQNIRNNSAEDKCGVRNQQPTKSGNAKAIHLSKHFRRSKIGVATDNEASTSNLNVPMNELSCSSNVSNMHPTSFSRNNTKNESENTNSTIISKRIKIQDVRKEFIRELQRWSTLDNDYYTIYLKQYVKFEELDKNDDKRWKSFYKKKIDLDNLVDKFYRDESETLGPKQHREIDIDRKHERHSMYDIRMRTKTRIEFRNDMLNNLLQHSSSSNGWYEEMFDKFIKWEESIIDLQKL